MGLLPIQISLFFLDQKLAVGGMPEKILTAFQSVLDEHVNEDVAVHRFHAAIQQVVKMEKEAMETGSKGKNDYTNPRFNGQCKEKKDDEEKIRVHLFKKKKKIRVHSILY